MTNILSNGGGTQSAAVIALIIEGRIPKPDFTCIVDTGRERGTTWKYLDEVTAPALKRIGIEVHRIRKSEWGSAPDHGLDWLSHNGKTVLLPAFTSQSNPTGKLPGFCSKTWKVETQQRYVREVLGVKTSEQRNWIGFSLDEFRRIFRMMNGEDYKSGRIWFPLVEGVPMKREGARATVLRMGWPPPPRSSCWNCPNHTDDEWADIKRNDPPEFDAACLMEKEVQKVDPEIWFHKSCVPLGEVNFDVDPDLFGKVNHAEYCDTGGCFT